MIPYFILSRAGGSDTLFSKLLQLKRGGDFLEKGGLCENFLTIRQIWFRKGEGPYKDETSKIMIKSVNALFTKGDFV